MRIGCVLMAAGNSLRFGSNKLLAEYGDTTFIGHALAIVPKERIYATAVVSQYPEILALARAQGFCAVKNARPEAGQSLSIRLGMEALPEAEALMFLVADQPFLKRESLAGEIDFFLENPAHIVAMGFLGQRGNPAIFPNAYFPALYSLEGDEGGSRIIRAHEAALRLYEIRDARELYDVDSPAQLAILRKES